jgi:hypothetical protein
VPFVAVVVLVSAIVEVSLKVVGAVAEIFVVVAAVVVDVVSAAAVAFEAEELGEVATAGRGVGAGTGAEGAESCASLAGDDLEERRNGGEGVVAGVIRRRC